MNFFVSGDITGINNIQMSYASFAKTIGIPYKVNITGWPLDVRRIYPQKLSAEETRGLYTAWSTGTAHWYRMTNAEAKVFAKEANDNGELDPKPRQKRKSNQRDGSDDDEGSGEGDRDVTEEEEDRPKKKVKSTHKSSKPGSSKQLKDAKKSSKPTVSKVQSSKSKEGSGGGRKSTKEGSGGGRKPTKEGSGGGRKSTKEGSGGGSKSTKRTGPGKAKKAKKMFVVESDEEADSPDLDDDEDEAEFSD